MATSRRLIVDRPTYSRPAYTAPSNSSPHTPVAHPSTRGVCVGGGTEMNESSRVCAKQVAADNILAQLAALPAAEQKQLLDRAAAAQLLLVESKRADRDVSMWSAAAYDAFCRVIGGVGAAGVGPQVARRLLGAATAWQPVEQFMSVAGLSELPVVDRQAVYNMLADLLVQHAKELARYTGAPFSVKFIANLAQNISGVFDAAFPGYLEAGLAHVVARRHRLLAARS